MTQFKIYAERIGETDPAKKRAVFLYDNMTSSFTDEQYRPVIASHSAKGTPHTFEPTSINAPKRGKSTKLKSLKIQLGLSCNYSCEYCSQRFVPHADETNRDDVQPFLDSLPNWFDGGADGLGKGVRIEYWGGEPFVYWKTLKPLAEALRVKYPNAQFYITTNGSLLDAEKNAWLDALGLFVAVSHDGPGYHVRGLDPLDDPEKRAAIVALWQILGAQGRMSFNAMMHKGNPSRAAVNRWLVERFGHDVKIGEGSFVDAYDVGGLAQSMPNLAWSQAYAKRSFSEVRAGSACNMNIGQTKITDFIQSIQQQRQAVTLGQKCGMDARNKIAVDLRGNVLTCQNVSAAAVAPNGRNHNIGHVNDMKAVTLDTSTHWSQRNGCKDCPVLQLCKGACMFLEGERWEASCNSAYFDNVAFLAAAVEVMTGYVPVFIEGPQPQGRKDIFGLSTPNTPTPNAQAKAKRVIPIMQAA